MEYLQLSAFDIHFGAVTSGIGPRWIVEGDSFDSFDRAAGVGV